MPGWRRGQKPGPGQSGALKAALAIHQKTFSSCLENIAAQRTSPFPSLCFFICCVDCLPLGGQLLPSLHACCCCLVHFWQSNHDSAAAPQKNLLLPPESHQSRRAEWIYCCSHVSGAAEATAVRREIADASVDLCDGQSCAISSWHHLSWFQFYLHFAHFRAALVDRGGCFFLPWLFHLFCIIFFYYFAFALPFRAPEL